MASSSMRRTRWWCDDMIKCGIVKYLVTHDIMLGGWLGARPVSSALVDWEWLNGGDQCHPLALTKYWSHRMTHESRVIWINPLNWVCKSMGRIILKKVLVDFSASSFSHKYLWNEKKRSINFHFLPLLLLFMRLRNDTINENSFFFLFAASFRVFNSHFIGGR